VRQFGLYPLRATGACEGPALVREDRAGRTAGGPVAWRHAAPGSRVRQGEPLTASKRETRLQMRPPADSLSGETPRRRRGREAAGGQRATVAAEPCSWSTAIPYPPTRPDAVARARVGPPTTRPPPAFSPWLLRGVATRTWQARPARGRGRRGPTRPHPEPGRETRQRRRVLWFQRHGRRGHRGRTSPLPLGSTILAPVDVPCVAGWSSGSSSGS